MQQTNWIEVIRHNTQASSSLFCFHHAGGAASFFNAWQNRFPDTVNLYAIQLPGRETRFGEVAPASLRACSEAIASALSLPTQTNNFFFGHSMGALIAYEVLQIWSEQQKRLPDHLFVSACRAPHIPERCPLHHLDDNALMQNLAAYNGTPDSLFEEHPELLELLLPMMRSDFTLAETYLPSLSDAKTLDCPITAFLGQDDPTVLEEDMSPWANYSAKSFALKALPGDHFYLNAPECDLFTKLSRACAKPIATEC